MKRIYLPNKGFVNLLMTCLLLFSSNLKLEAQITIATNPTGVTFWSAVNPGAIVFGVRNNNNSPMLLTNLSNYVPANHNTWYSLWYHPTAIGGAPSAITTANGWIQIVVPTQVIGPATTGVIPFFSNINLNIPANTTYRLALVSTVSNGPYYGTANSSADIFSLGGMDILTQNNSISPSYAGLFPGPPTLTPRSFYGSLTFITACPSTPISAPQAPSVIRCQTGGVNLIASSSDPNYKHYWYDNQAGDNLLHIGDTFTTPFLNKEDTFIVYVDARDTNFLNCKGDVTEVKAIILGNPHASLIAGTLFQGQFNMGGLGNIDFACAGDTLTYELLPPTGFSYMDYGTEWIITNLSIRTSNGTAPSDTTIIPPNINSNAGLMFVPALNEGDSTFILQITVQDLTNGCDTVIERFINVAPKPQASFVAGNVCKGTNLGLVNNTSMLGTGTIDYTWSFGDNNTSIAVNPQHLYSTAGNYVVTLTAVSDQGCYHQASHTVTVFEMPQAGFTSTGNCANDSTYLTNQSIVYTGPFSYEWHLGKNNHTTSIENPSYYYGAQGSYTVRLIVENNGCLDTAHQVVNILAAPIAAFTAQNVCQGSTTNFLNATSFQPGNISYEWVIDGNTLTIENPTYTFSSAGNHSVILKATQQNGCSDVYIDTVTINPLPGAGFTTTMRITGLVDFQATETGHVTYVWNFGDGNSAMGATTSHTYDNNGAFTVVLTVTSADGCTDSSFQTISIIVSSSFPEITNGSLKIHPNPYSGSTNISYELPSGAHIFLAVYNVEGKLVQKIVDQKQQSGDHTYRFSGMDAGYGPGMYLIRLIVDGHVQMQRAIELK